MPKKVTILVGMLLLLLATAPLALAQQDAGINQSVREAQVSSPDTAQQEGQGTVAAPTQNVWTVSIGDFFFDPADAAIGAGDAIVFVNEGVEAHTVTSDDGQFDSGRLEPGESVTVSFEGLGTLTYHCQIHPEMIGSVTVGGDGGGEAPTSSGEPESDSGQPSGEPTQRVSETMNVPGGTQMNHETMGYRISIPS